jgi:hypothetical protein
MLSILLLNKALKTALNLVADQVSTVPHSLSNDSGPIVIGYVIIVDIETWKMNHRQKLDTVFVDAA